MEFNRQALEEEWKLLSEKVETATFVNPKDIRRLDEITSLLMTDGQSSNIKFKLLRGRRTTKGMNTKGYIDHGGKTGL